MAAVGATAAGPVSQHMIALAQANRTRLARAELKQEVAAGTRSVSGILIEVPWMAETMTIIDLLMAQHRWGRMRARRLLTAIPMGEHKTVGTMTARQRHTLAGILDGTVPHYLRV